MTAMYQVLAESLKAWFAQRAASKGAALAFYALFSMTPILLLAVAAGGYFFGADTARDEVIARMQGLAGPSGALAIQGLLESAQDPASGVVAIVLAALLMVIGAASVFAELKGSLDELWGTPAPRQSGLRLLMDTQLRSIALVGVLTVLLIVCLAAGAALEVLDRFAGGFWSSSAGVLAAISGALLFAVTVCLFAVIFKTLPDAPLSWRDAVIGGLFTAALLSIGKHAIGLYLGTTGVASGFGAAGSIIALMLWVYYSAQIFFIGAEFTRHYALRLGSLRPAAADGREAECAEPHQCGTPNVK